ncbi:kinesin KP1-like isoform B [Micractinium conductrix]|uniref:Kinesin KP1-like isoform B n=1 Tax=Micractinium conductrix TaxID=554055 RepID=A0A2P6VSH3_9CHLO|nr:kinesin KP1-like isoform B [Micractinium conductrix]|eukprot:PSC77000.1 kinesin KP1-like isoform B [Micractinium conductrix]
MPASGSEATSVYAMEVAERPQAAAEPAAAPTPALQVQLPGDEDATASPPLPAAEASFSPPAPQPLHSAEPALPGQQQQQQPARSPSPSLRASLNPSEARSLKATSRRQQAAEWVAAMTGCAVPHDSDAAFRASLRDGVTLCRLANVLRPGSIGRIMDYTQGECSSPTGDVIRSFENVANFIAAAKEITGGDDACVLSASDLEDDEERPAVADCLLALQAWWFAQQASPPAASRAWGSRPASPRPASPAGGGSPGVTPPPPLRQPPSPRATPEFSFTPHASAAVHRAAAAPRGHGTDGMEYLMRTCNHMLKSHMGLPATPLPPPPSRTTGVTPEIALDAVGPVLETVLQNLTAEYEKRLLAKDQEFKLSQEAQERSRREIARLKQELKHWQEEAKAVKYLPAPEKEMSDEEREAFERKLVQEKEAAAAMVAAKETELRAAQEAADARQAEADAKLNELEDAVQKYQGMEQRLASVQDENRHLYNTVQDLKGAIRVFCRVRPRGRTGDNSNSMVEPGVEDGQLQVFSSKHSKWHSFRFDKVFGEESTQDEVYAETQPLIRSVLDGYNVCIFAYGQTGSGKTHTMSGTDVAHISGRGLNYRTLDDLFQLNREREGEVEYSISVQLLEIYNESIRDLLVSDAEARQQRSLNLVNNHGSGRNVPDAIQVSVTCTDDVLKVMERGQSNRAVAETKMNDRSSRSHQVLTIIVEGTNKLSHGRTHGCLHLIDLAGSERVGKSGAEGQQLLEAQHINKSLSALGNVMHALANKNAHVPFRDSKLTQLLQDSLSGQAKTMMFMHVAPEQTSVSETLSTLNFGKNVTEITLGAAKKNAESGVAWEAKERAMKMEREAAAAQRALVAEQQKRAQVEAELEALRAQLAPPPATAAPASGSGRLTPRGSQGSGGGTTPRTNSVGARPPQVSRLNLGSGSKAPGGGARPPIAKLNLQKLQPREGEQENKTPLSARAPGSSRIPVPSPSPPSAAVRSSAHPSGSLTARPSLGRPTRSPQLSSSIPRGPLSARESPAEAAARRAALQRNAGAAGAGAGSSLRRSIAAPSSSAAMRRSVSGATAAAVEPRADVASTEAAVMQGLRSVLHRYFPDLVARVPGWMPGNATHHCSWQHVACNAQRVVQLSFLHTCTVRANCCAKCHEQLALPTASRTPPELAALTRLQRLQELHIHWPNDPLGPFLPQEWLQPGVWPELNSLTLEASMHAYALPLPDIPPGALPSLRWLVLHPWALRSTLPASWGSSPDVLPALQHLELQLDVQGTLPAVWSRGFSSVRSISVEMQSTRQQDRGSSGGTLPADWAAGFKRLQTLNLVELGLTGPFPPAWLADGSFPSLHVLELSGNALSGTLPPQLFRSLPSLSSLALPTNRFEGGLPEEWAGSQVRVLNLPGNRLSGAAFPPAWITRGMPILQELVLDNNGALTGVLPDQLPWPKLHMLSLQGTAVQGSIPSGWCSLDASLFLKKLYISNTDVDPALPSCAELEDLTVFCKSNKADAETAAPGGRVRPGLAGSLTLFCLTAALVGAGAAGRLLLRRQRRQRLRAALEEQTLLQRLPEEQSLSHAGSSDAGGIGPAMATVGQAPRMPGSLRPGPPVSLGDSVAGTAQHAQQWQWGLPTESMRVPASSLEFSVDERGQLVDLGVGTFAVVYLARLDPGQQRVAVKVLELEAGVDAGMVWQEVALMRQCCHPRVVPLLGVAIQGSLLMLAMELMAGGTLAHALAHAMRRQQLGWAQRGHQVALDIAEALDHLHTQLGILHSDLKPNNVLLSADWRASISDLGVAQVVGGGAQVPIGYNRRYGSPEQLLGQSCTLSSDMYSFGLVLVSLLTQEPLVQRVGWRLPHAPDECPQEVVALIQQCLADEQRQRPTAAQTLARLRACAGR